MITLILQLGCESEVSLCTWNQAVSIAHRLTGEGLIVHLSGVQEQELELLGKFFWKKRQL